MRRLIARPAIALALSAVVALPAATVPAWAAAPEPSRSVDPARFSGRWYEFARLPNNNQRACQAPTYDWSRNADGSYGIALTCRAGSPTGKASTRRAKATILDKQTSAKLQVSFLGGVVKTEYRILDHAPDYGWVLMGTSGGNYLWLLSTRLNPPKALRDAAVARAAELGYPVARLEYPKQG
jgi:apolipoprotein D and lipocalin family protein